MVPHCMLGKIFSIKQQKLLQDEGYQGRPDVPFLHLQTTRQDENVSVWQSHNHALHQSSAVRDKKRNFTCTFSTKCLKAAVHTSVILASILSFESA